MRARWLSALSLLVVGLGVSSLHSAPPRRSALPADVLEELSLITEPALVARLYGVEEPVAPTRRSRLDADSGGRRRGPAKLDDVPIGSSPTLTETRPTVVARPGSTSTLVSAHAAYTYPTGVTNRCPVRHSDDRGHTWTGPTYLPLPEGAIACDGPALAWSADGRWLVAAYQGLTGGRTDTPIGGGWTRTVMFGRSDVVVSVSRDGGRVWSPPVTALEGDEWSTTMDCPADPSLCQVVDRDEGFNYGRPSLALPEQPRDGRRIYLAASGVSQNQATLPSSGVYFTRSTDRGIGWSEPEALDSTDASPSVRYLQAGQLAAGKGDAVLASWYDSTDDGRFVGQFEIRTAYSPDAGESWDPAALAARDEDELGVFLGPGRAYKRWWPGMLPRLVVDSRGRAHVAYAHDPVAGNGTAEEGDIRYVTSGGPPWDAWSPPVTVNDDGPGRAQGYPALALRQAGQSTIVDLVWEDTRLSPEDPFGSEAALNRYYDLFHSWKTPGNSGWFPSQRVSDRSSLQTNLQESGTGLATTQVLIYAVWVDRRDQAAINVPGDDVFGSRILEGQGR